MNTTAPGRAPALILMLVTAALATVALAAPAQAVAYRYWSYWQGATGTWVSAQTGPGEHTLVDSDVQGWRFGITTEAPTETPDNPPAFDALCPDLAAAGPSAGEVRVAVVIDSGFAADAPEGQEPPADTLSCVALPEGSTGNQALAAGGAVTEDNGLICAINGYPEDECGAEVPDADASAAATAAEVEQPNPAVVVPSASAVAAPEADTGSDTGSDPDSDSASASWVGFAIGALVLVALVGAGFWILRQRRNPSAQ